MRNPRPSSPGCIESIRRHWKITITSSPAVEVIIAQAAQRSGRGLAEICREILSMAKFGGSKPPDASCVYFKMFLGDAGYTLALRLSWENHGELRFALMRADES